MHECVFEVFFAEGFAHAVDEVAPRLRLYVDEFGELCEVQVQDKVALVLCDVFVGCHFVHEFTFPDEVVFFVVGGGFFRVCSRLGCLDLQCTPLVQLRWG